MLLTAVLQVRKGRLGAGTDCVRFCFTLRFGVVLVLPWFGFESLLLLRPLGVHGRALPPEGGVHLT